MKEEGPKIFAEVRKKKMPRACRENGTKTVEWGPASSRGAHLGKEKKKRWVDSIRGRGGKRNINLPGRKRGGTRAPKF